MSEDRQKSIQRLLEEMADHLEDFLEGDELALETLGEAIQEGDFTTEDVCAAIMALRSLAGASLGTAVAAGSDAPGKGAHRILSAEERDSLSPEAWGFLLDLRRRGSLDAEQFEHVLDRLTTSGVRPVGIELAREVAAHVALKPSSGARTAEFGHGNGDGAH